MQIPRIFAKGVLCDGERYRAHLPPTIANLNYNNEESVKPSNEEVEVNLAFVHKQMVSGAKKRELFLGCKLTAGEEGFCDGPGIVEGPPHNTLHSWVGSGVNPEREDMGAFYSAAKDLIIYVHQSNIDRLAFIFYDENLRFVRIKVRDLRDTHKLGYKYEEIPLPWLNAKSKPTGSLAASIMKRKSGSLLSQRAVMEKERALVSSVTFEVHRPKRGRLKEEKVREEEIVFMEGILMKCEVYAKFDMFVNLGAEEENIAGPLRGSLLGHLLTLCTGRGE
ncbi:polyphenol oxidase I, chloroplastic-like [Wolffia australiana]